MEDATPAPISAPPRLTKAQLKRRHERRTKKVEREIAHLQRSGSLIMPHTSFTRVVHEELQKLGDFSIRSDAITALQTAAEDHVTEIFAEANQMALYNGRETVSSRDLMFVAPHAVAAVAEMSDSSEHQLLVPDQFA